VEGNGIIIIIMRLNAYSFELAVCVCNFFAS